MVFNNSNTNRYSLNIIQTWLGKHDHVFWKSKFSPILRDQISFSKTNMQFIILRLISNLQSPTTELERQTKLKFVSGNERTCIRIGWDWNRKWEDTAASTLALLMEEAGLWRPSWRHKFKQPCSSYHTSSTTDWIYSWNCSHIAGMSNSDISGGQGDLPEFPN